MVIRIAVVDPLPMFTRGVILTLAEDGHAAESPDDVVAWVRRPDAAMVLLTVTGEPDWRLLVDIVVARPDVRLIAVLPGVAEDTVVRAVTAGAVGALPRDARPDQVRDSVRAALTGRSVLPVEVLRSIVARRPAGAAGAPGGTAPAQLLTDGEVEWLRQLAGGTTVASLAEQVGYSERMMFRLLARVYERLGVSNRTMAIIRARDEGWL